MLNSRLNSFFISFEKARLIYFGLAFLVFFAASVKAEEVESIEQTCAEVFAVKALLKKGHPKREIIKLELRPKVYGAPVVELPLFENASKMQ